MSNGKSSNNGRDDDDKGKGGSKGNDKLEGKSGSDKIDGKSGNDKIDGKSGNDKLIGGSGNDNIKGGSGNDRIKGDSGNDTLDGGSGCDVLDGGSGKDTLVYRMSENRGARDEYDGGSGTDTLRLEFTQAEWDRADVKADVARFLRWLESQDGHGNGNGNRHDCEDEAFEFRSFGLDVRNIEGLEVRVNGVVVNPGGGGGGGGGGGNNVTVNAVDDVGSVAENGTVSGSLLANDVVTGAAIQSVQLVGAPTAGSVTLAADGSFVFSAGTAFDSLGQGQTGTASFTYRVTAVGGVTDTATMTISVAGANDGPQANPDAITVGENAAVYLNLLGNDTDADANASLSLVAASTQTGQGVVTLNNGAAYFETGSAFDYLKAGETATVVVNYVIQDEFGALSASTATLTVVGENDDPVTEPSRVVLVTNPGETPLEVAIPTDADGDTLTATITQAQGLGLLRDGDGNVVTLGSALSAGQLESLTYAPAPGTIGTVQFVSYQLSDGGGGVASSTVLLLVVGGAPAIPSGPYVVGTLAHDQFDFDAVGGSATSVFAFGDGAQGDTLDLSDLLTGYVAGASDASSFVSLVEAGGSTTVMVNADGAGNDAVAVAVLEGSTGLTVNELLADGNLFLG